MTDSPPIVHASGLGLVKAQEKDEESRNKLQQVDSTRTIGRFTMRGKTDDLPQDWWFASTAIPLLAATIGPLANVLSIAALVTKWKDVLPDNGQLPNGTDNNGVGIPDPPWEITLNAISLAVGFFGNFFLLLNFTRRIRYIVALPVTIISWYFATGILTGITIAMNKYIPPIRPGETYSQGYWYAIIASVLYMIGSMILMVNMLGYFLGHYPQHFDLDDDQRTLILQTMMFFFWLAGGAAIYSRVCGFTYANALYFCDVTVLTVGFGDFVPTNDAGRAILFPYSVIGIIFLGLMINSIRKFAVGMSRDKVIRKHQLTERERTAGRTVTSEKELRERLGLPQRADSSAGKPSRSRRTSANIISRRTSLDQYGHFKVEGRTIVFQEQRTHTIQSHGRGGAGRYHRPKGPLSRDAKMQDRASKKSKKTKSFRLARHREKLIVLKEERDRFNAMRDIQARTNRFKQYISLGMSVFAFGILWCLGALVFYYAEHRIQDLSYFESLYFCYVSLLTIGYGDFSPKSNAGKPFFVVWSLLAIPTMTILVSDMGNTVVSSINRGTFTLADWTVMPKEGVWHDFLEKHPKLRVWLERKTKEREAKKRLEEGFALQNPDEEADIEEVAEDGTAIDKKAAALEKLADTPELSDHDLARRLATAIKKTANDLRADKPKKYSYEEWVEFTRLIRFSGKCKADVEEEEEEEGMVEWDWIGEDSPMLADISETEWVLDRLCESLNRYTRKQSREDKQANSPRGLDHFSFDSPNKNESESEPATSHSTTAHERPKYPAHPGARSPGETKNYHHQHSHHSQSHHQHDISPVLSRGPSGVEVIRLKKGTEDKEDIEDEWEEEGVSVSGGGGGLGQIGEGSGSSNASGERSSRTAVDTDVNVFDTEGETPDVKDLDEGSNRLMKGKGRDD